MPERDKGVTIGKLLLTLLYILTFPLLLLWLSGDWLWSEGILFCVWFVALCFTVVVYLYKKDPALLSERYKQPGSAGQRGWDVLVVIGLLIGFTAWIIIMPLDAKRFGWTTGFPTGLKIVGTALLLMSFYLFVRVYIENTYLSPLVRIQKEREQKVITTGVYGIVRHPMYLAAVLLFMGAPLLMGSVYGLLAGVLLTVLLAFRIIGEEKMLLAELKGYAQYQQKVTKRLIPFVW